MLDDGDWFRKIWEPLSKKWIRIHFFIQRHPRLISIFRGCPKTKKRILNNIWSISLIHCSWLYCSWFCQQAFLIRKRGCRICDILFYLIFHLRKFLARAVSPFLLHFRYMQSAADKTVPEYFSHRHNTGKLHPQKIRWHRSRNQHQR